MIVEGGFNLKLMFRLLTFCNINTYFVISILLWCVIIILKIVFKEYTLENGANVNENVKIWKSEYTN